MKTTNALIIDRDDLISGSKDNDITSITYTDIKDSTQIFTKSELILFIDNNHQTIILKNRFGDDGTQAINNYWKEKTGWKRVSEHTPPTHKELLVKSPEGVIHLANWREAYSIFTCQGKRESSYDWQWKEIEYDEE